LQAIYDGGNYMKTNAQNAKFDFTDGAPNNFRLATLRAGDFNLFIMSLTMEEILKELDDPRMAIFFRPIGNDPTKTQFKGLLNGPNASATSITVADYSLTGTIFREHTGDVDANFMTAWEANCCWPKLRSAGSSRPTHKHFMKPACNWLSNIGKRLCPRII
jgi:hypothetical protein